MEKLALFVLALFAWVVVLEFFLLLVVRIAKVAQSKVFDNLNSRIITLLILSLVVVFGMGASVFSLAVVLPIKLKLIAQVLSVLLLTSGALWLHNKRK
jgi:hypothetical protein